MRRMTTAASAPSAPAPSARRSATANPRPQGEQARSRDVSMLNLSSFSYPVSVVQVSRCIYLRYPRSAETGHEYGLLWPVDGRVCAVSHARSCTEKQQPIRNDLEETTYASFERGPGQARLVTLSRCRALVGGLRLVMAVKIGVVQSLVPLPTFIASAFSMVYHGVHNSFNQSISDTRTRQKGSQAGLSTSEHVLASTPSVSTLRCGLTSETHTASFYHICTRVQT